MTTLSIFIVAIISCIQDLITQTTNRKINKENKERIQILKNKYLGYTTATNLSTLPKLMLNYVNKDFFANHVIENKVPKKEFLKKQDISNQLMIKALIYFKKSLSDRLKGFTGEKIVLYLDEISNKLKFIQIIVQDELNAYTLFETLNARGVELTATDLLKNYLFNILKDDVDTVNSKWNKINDIIGTKELPEYLRCIINSEKELVRKNKLFKQIKTYIRDNITAMKFLDRLYGSTSIYIALQNPNDDFWNEYSSANIIRECIEILRMLNVKIPLALLVVTKDKFNKEEEFIKVLRACVILSIRYSITSTRTNTLEIHYNKAAIEVFRGTYTDSKGVLEYLKKVYISDESFADGFATYIKKTNSANDKKIIKFLLVSIEKHLGSQCSYDKATIEHILPENPEKDQWTSFSSQEKQELVYRLGNYVLLQENLNREIANREYDKKRLIYVESNYKLTQYIGTTFQEWNPRSIKQYQTYLSKKAVGIWKINFN